MSFFQRTHRHLGLEVSSTIRTARLWEGPPVHLSIKMPAAARSGSLGWRRPMEDAMGYEEAKQQGRAAMALLAECCKYNDEKGASELLHNAFPLLHVVYQTEVVRKRVFGNVQHLVPYEAYAAISKSADTKWMR